MQAAAFPMRRSGMIAVAPWRRWRQHDRNESSWCRRRRNSHGSNDHYAPPQFAPGDRVPSSCRRSGFRGGVAGGSVSERHAVCRPPNLIARNVHAIILPQPPLALSEVEAERPWNSRKRTRPDDQAPPYPHINARNPPRAVFALQRQRFDDVRRGPEPRIETHHPITGGGAGMSSCSNKVTRHHLQQRPRADVRHLDPTVVELATLLVVQAVALGPAPRSISCRKRRARLHHPPGRRPSRKTGPLVAGRRPSGSGRQGRIVRGLGRGRSDDDPGTADAVSPADNRRPAHPSSAAAGPPRSFCPHIFGGRRCDRPAFRIRSIRTASGCSTPTACDASCSRSLMVWDR
ncbi:unnamed protein product [Acanthosepion pharaonis]|uniref:Uncharacterized protein n=1 Tax=Acanthosepion pharaonis TaxID=158019 RepID=A0A812D9A1_ACAPH|nr:unnamed protein product [Sepia pharaonis]